MYDKIHDSLEDIRIDAARKEELWNRILTKSQRASEETEARKMKSRKIYKITLIAAAAIMLFTGAALAVSLIGLPAITVPDHTIEHPVTGDTGIQISYTKPMAGPEEFVDWAARCDALTKARDVRMEELFPEEKQPYLFDPDEFVVETSINVVDGIHTLTNMNTGESITMTDEEMEAYSEKRRIFSENWNSSRQSLLEELAPQYGLTVRDDENMHNTPGTGSGAEQEFLNALASSVCSGDLFTGDVSWFDKFYCFDGGSFGASYAIDAPSGIRVSTYIRYTPMNEYVTGSEVGYYMFDGDSFEPRSYVTADGTELTVCQNDGQALVYSYLDGGYCVLELHNDSGALTEEDTNYALDFLDFSAIGK